MALGEHPSQRGHLKQSHKQGEKCCMWKITRIVTRPSETKECHLSYS